MRPLRRSRSVFDLDWRPALELELSGLIVVAILCTILARCWLPGDSWAAIGAIVPTNSVPAVATADLCGHYHQFSYDYLLVVGLTA